jgi:hypothetical protein
MSELHPLRVLIPVASFWVVVNVPSYDWYHGSILGQVFYWAITGSFVNRSTYSIFPLTLPLAIITFFFAIVRLRKLQVNRVSAFILAMSMPFAFVGGFEAVYQNLGFFFRPDIFTLDAAGQALLCSWVLLGLAAAPYWRITLKAILSAAVVIIGFGFWVAFGYPQIYENGALTEYALALNIITKFAFFLLFFVLLYDGTESPGSDTPGLSFSTLFSRRLTVHLRFHREDFGGDSRFRDPLEQRADDGGDEHDEANQREEAAAN